MHELGITQRILEVALERANQAHATRVTAVHLELGEDSDVAPESVGLYWPEVARGTLADGAQLYFATVTDPWVCRVAAIDVEGAETQARV